MYNEFVRLACKAYNILRKNGNLLITLFTLMLNCGIQELSDVSDIYYLRDMLRLDLSDAEADAHFQKTISECLSSRATLINDAAHMLMHVK